MSTFHENLVQSLSNFKTKYITPLQSNMDDVFNIYGATKNVFPYDPTVNLYPYSRYGVTIDRNDKTGIFTIDGTSTEGRILFLTSRSGNWIANNYVGMKLNIAGTKINEFNIHIRYYDSSTASSISKSVNVNYTNDYIIEDYPYIMIGLNFNGNITFDNDTLSFMLRSDAMGDIAKTNRELTEAIAKLDDNKENADVLNNVDLNSVKTNGIYFVRSNCTNKPNINSGTLIVSDGGKPSINANQVYIDYVGAIYARYSSDNGSTWGDWCISTHYDSVTITADGVKNYRTLLNELFALIDKGKNTHGSVLMYGSNYYHLTFMSSTYIVCSLNTISTDTGEMLSRVMNLNETDSQYRETVIDATGQVSYVNKDTLIPNSGIVFRFYYNS